jgi:hypothetical protein
MMFDLKTSLSAVQDYLRSGKTLEQFEAEHGIRGKTDGKHLILDYDQISVKWTEPYGYVCRGLILDAVTFDVIAFGLAKFFNFGEHYASPIDWSSAKVYEKIDGSMVNRWWSPHTERFEYSTRFQLPGNLEANTLDDVITWKGLIDRCMAQVESLMLTELEDQPKDETWTFEVCSRHNMVVVRHDGFTAKLLAIRNIRTLQERAVEKVQERPLTDASHIPKSYRFASGAEVAEFANKHAATELEGFVVCDGSFNRVKIKSDQYVQLHRAKDGLQGINNIILLAKGNDYEEIVVHFPEYKDDLDTVAGIIQRMISQHEEVYEKLKGIESQKDFALAVQASTIAGTGLAYPAALYSTRAGKVPNVRQAFIGMSDSGFCKLFKSRVRTALGDRYTDEEVKG